LVMAARKVAGAAYEYSYEYQLQKLAQQKKKRVVNRKKRAAFVLVAVTCTMVIAMLFLTGLGYTYLQAKLACANYELQKIKQENSVLTGEIEKTKLEIAGLKSLDRVEYLAVNQLGMIKDPGIEYIAMNGINPGSEAAEASGTDIAHIAMNNEQAGNVALNDAANNSLGITGEKAQNTGKTLLVATNTLDMDPELNNALLNKASVNLFAKIYQLITQAIGEKG
jgi:cell division protein FtsL